MVIFGFISYAVHLNGYRVMPDGTIKMFIARRSPKKQTWPNYLDNMVCVFSSHIFYYFEVKEK